MLLAAGALSYPWRRLVPASAVACLLWAIAYALLGVVSGGIFDSPLLVTLLATLLILAVSAVLNLIVGARRRRSGEPDASDGESPGDEPPAGAPPAAPAASASCGSA